MHLFSWTAPSLGFPGVSDSKESACNVGDLGLTPGLGRSLEDGMATHSSILAWENPHGQRSLAGYSPWAHRELDTTERLSTLHHLGHTIHHLMNHPILYLDFFHQILEQFT